MYSALTKEVAQTLKNGDQEGGKTKSTDEAGSNPKKISEGGGETINIDSEACGSLQNGSDQSSNGLEEGCQDVGDGIKLSGDECRQVRCQVGHSKLNDDLDVVEDAPDGLNSLDQLIDLLLSEALDRPKNATKGTSCDRNNCLCSYSKGLCDGIKVSLQDSLDVDVKRSRGVVSDGVDNSGYRDG